MTFLVLIFNKSFNQNLCPSFLTTIWHFRDRIETYIFDRLLNYNFHQMFRLHLWIEFLNIVFKFLSNTEKSFIPISWRNIKTIRNVYITTLGWTELRWAEKVWPRAHLSLSELCLSWASFNYFLLLYVTVMSGVIKWIPHNSWVPLW